MNTIIEKKKNLFSCSGSTDDIPLIHIGTCQCGHTFFPPHEFGCEACGTEFVQIQKIPAKGRLKAHAVAHMHTLDPEKPVVIGEVVLENGPCIIAFLDACSDTSLAEETSLIGKLVEVGRNENEDRIVDLFFAPQGGQL